MENKQDLAKRIGLRVKKVRKSYELSLKKLADDTELSISLLSRVENGLAMPSISTLQIIAKSLKVDIGHFFKTDTPKQFIISPKTNPRTILSGKGYKNIELLAEGMEEVAFMEPAIVTTEHKNQGEDVKLMVHDGQEFMYVLEGNIELTLGENKYIMNKGDAAYWNGHVPHKGLSLSKKPAKSLNVHFIPGKRVNSWEFLD